MHQTPAKKGVGSPPIAPDSYIRRMNRTYSICLAVLIACTVAVVDCVAAGEAPSQLTPVNELPFTFEELAVYFTQALETQPEELHRKCVIFKQSAPGGLHDTYDLIVVVTSAEEHLGVTFLANADYGMNYLREFLESRFFFPEESEQFYSMLHGTPSSRWVEMFRFRVQLIAMNTPDWEIVGLTFRPRSILNPDYPRPLD